MTSWEDFKKRFKLLGKKRPDLIVNVLSNIFTMRLIGNKTHGDLAEVGICEFINQFMYDFKSIHVGKDLFRSKKNEEDIVIKNEINKVQFPVSLKAYGDGPLQLSTDKNKRMFSFLQKEGEKISEKKKIRKIFSSSEFSEFKNVNIMPLIYKEKIRKCNIMIFNYEKAMKETKKIFLVEKSKRFDFEKGTLSKGKGRSHPIYLFINKENQYICEVRYGGATANALQRGFWTHTNRALPYFDSLTSGWIDYSHNENLVKLFSLALNSSEKGHKLANKILQKDIDELREL